MVTSRSALLVAFGAGALCCAAGLMVAGFRFESEEERLTRATWHLMKAIAPPPERARTVPVGQMPAIRVRATKDGVVVFAMNDSAQQPIELLPGEDRVLVHYAGESAPDAAGTIRGNGGRLVRLGPRILAPGEATEEIPVALPDYWTSATVEYEHHDREITAKTGVKTVNHP